MRASSAYPPPPDGSPLPANQVPTLNVRPTRVAGQRGEPTVPSGSDPEDEENSGSDKDGWYRRRNRHPRVSGYRSERSRAGREGVKYTPQTERSKPIGKCPTFSGSDSVTGFFHIFEMWCDSARYNDSERVTALCTAMTGDARDFI